MKYSFKIKKKNCKPIFDCIGEHGINIKNNPDFDRVDDDATILFTVTDQRTIGENSLMHVYFSKIASETGNSLKAVKNYLKEEFLGYEETIFINKDGEEVPTRELRSTTSLDIKEAAEFITQIEVWALEFGIKLNQKRMYEN